MTEPYNRPKRSFDESMRARREKRRERIRTELNRNREGGHRFPTWAMAVILAVIVLAWAYFVFWS